MPILKNARHEMFCLGVIKFNSQVKAYREAGFAATTSARQNASELMKRPEIAARVAELRREQFQKMQMEADEILGRLAGIARGDMRLLYDEDGRPREIHELTLEEAAMIQEVVETRTPQGKDANGEKLPDIVTRKVKLRDPTQALRMLAQNKKLIGSEADEALTNIAEAFAARMAAARARRAK